MAGGTQKAELGVADGSLTAVCVLPSAHSGLVWWNSPWIVKAVDVSRVAAEIRATLVYVGDSNTAFCFGLISIDG